MRGVKYEPRRFFGHSWCLFFLAFCYRDLIEYGIYKDVLGNEEGIFPETSLKINGILILI